MQRKSTVTGRFMKRFNRNQKVIHKGVAWRVCKDTVQDGVWSHTYYKLQRGSVVQFVRADYIKTKKQLETKTA